MRVKWHLCLCETYTHLPTSPSPHLPISPLPTSPSPTSTTSTNWPISLLPTSHMSPYPATQPSPGFLVWTSPPPSPGWCHHSKGSRYRHGSGVWGRYGDRGMRTGKEGGRCGEGDMGTEVWGQRRREVWRRRYGEGGTGDLKLPVLDDLFTCTNLPKN